MYEGVRSMPNFTNDLYFFTAHKTALFRQRDLATNSLIILCVCFYSSSQSNGSDVDISISEKDKQLREKEAEVKRCSIEFL
jgi:hypothetical protein